MKFKAMIDKQTHNNDRSVITVNANPRPNSVKEKITLHVLYFEDVNNTHSKGIDVVSTSWEACIKKFNKMNLGTMVMVVDKSFSSNLNR